MAVCPTLAALVTASPDVLSACISYLAPGKHIPEHRGPFRGVFALSILALLMPLAADGRPAAVLKVAGTEHRLADSEYRPWDETLPTRSLMIATRSERCCCWMCGGAACRSTCGFFCFTLPIFIVRVMARNTGPKQRSAITNFAGSPSAIRSHCLSLRIVRRLISVLDLNQNLTRLGVEALQMQACPTAHASVACSL